MAVAADGAVGTVDRSAIGDDLVGILKGALASTATASVQAHDRYMNTMDRNYMSLNIAQLQESPETLGALNSFSSAPVPNPWRPATSDK